MSTNKLIFAITSGIILTTLFIISLFGKNASDNIFNLAYAWMSGGIIAFKLNFDPLIHRWNRTWTKTLIKYILSGITILWFSVILDCWARYRKLREG